MSSFLEYAHRYTSIRPVGADYAATLHSRAAALQVHAGREELGDVLTEDNLNAFLRTLSGSPWTINKYRQDLLAIWRAAADENLVPYPNPRRIRRLPQSDLVIDCFSDSEARKLLATAEQTPGRLPNGVAKNKYWPAVIRAAWDTGLRRGDVWAIDRRLIKPDGTLRRPQNKTKRMVTCKLRPKTILAVERAGGTLSWPCDKKTFSNQFAWLVKQARISLGTFKWLRRSSGSYVESQQAGAGHKHLGQATPQIFDKHYDARLGGHTLPQPPEL